MDTFGWLLGKGYQQESGSTSVIKPYIMLCVTSIDAAIAMEYSTSNQEGIFRLRPFNSLQYLLKQVLQKNVFLDLEPLSKSEVSNLDLVVILTISDDYASNSLFC